MRPAPLGGGKSFPRSPRTRRFKVKHPKIAIMKLKLVPLLVLLSLLFACSKEKPESGYIDEARAAFNNKEYLEAEKFYERYLREVPEGAERWEAWERVAYVALNIRCDEALAADIFEAMALEYADRPELYQDVLIRLTEIYESNFRWQRALNAWQRLLSTPGLEPGRKARAHLHLAQIYQRKMEYANAMQNLEACLAMELSPNMKAEVLYNLSMIYADQGEKKLAEEKLIELTTMSTTMNNIQVQGLFMLGDLMEEQGKYKEALELFKSLEQTYPNPQAVEVRIKNLENRK